MDREHNEDMFKLLLESSEVVFPTRQVMAEHSIMVEDIGGSREVRLGAVPDVAQRFGRVSADLVRNQRQQPLEHWSGAVRLQHHTSSLPAAPR